MTPAQFYVCLTYVVSDGALTSAYPVLLLYVKAVARHNKDHFLQLTCVCDYNA